MSRKCVSSVRPPPAVRPPHTYGEPKNGQLGALPIDEKPLPMHCREGEGLTRVENGRYADRETALIFPIVLRTAPSRSQSAFHSAIGADYVIPNAMIHVPFGHWSAL